MWQGLWGDPGEERWHWEQRCMLRVGTRLSAEADVPMGNRLLVVEDLMQERPGSSGNLMSLRPQGHSKPLLIADLYMFPPFGSLLTTPVSVSLGMPKVILMSPWGRSGSSYCSYVLCILSPVCFSSFRILELWELMQWYPFPLLFAAATFPGGSECHRPNCWHEGQVRGVRLIGEPMP